VKVLIVSTRIPTLGYDWVLPRKARDQFRFGIGEWYGQSFARLTPEARRLFATNPGIPPCPFRSTQATVLPCNKKGGVCSLLLFHRDPEGAVRPVTDERRALRTLCPNRFLQNRTVFAWVGQELLGTTNPDIVGEVGFLEGASADAGVEGDDVGRIDHVLVHPTAEPLQWCALEIQAVYFSGKSMGRDFAAIAQHVDGELPFPAVNRRPDYRSSGPKRLMPQLQIKVPSLRRWGKKMVVVIDEAFFAALGPMDHVSHVSNCDIAWFIVRYEETENGFLLHPSKMRLTTLERAVEGLTGGTPVSCDVFEHRIRAKLAKTSKHA
jgi:hypothetical protein